MYSAKIAQIKSQFGDIANENFVLANNGTHHEVFLSNRYVIRFRKSRSDILRRESDFLKKLNHPLIPKILWMGSVGDSTAMVENRLPGTPLNEKWNKMSNPQKEGLVNDMVEFMRYMRNQSGDEIYSVSTGNTYSSFLEYVEELSGEQLKALHGIDSSRKITNEIQAIIEDSNLKKLFDGQLGISLVHGDLIMHNTLSENGRLTGILDWELALFGDPDYDLARLIYYEECARVYEEGGIDLPQETGYMAKLNKVVINSGLVENIDIFMKKAGFLRALFYLKALYWTLSSDNQEQNIEELIKNWNNGVNFSISYS